MRADVSVTAKTHERLRNYRTGDFTETNDNHITTHSGLINAFPVLTRCPHNTDAMAEGHRLYVKYVAVQDALQTIKPILGRHLKI